MASLLIVPLRAFPSDDLGVGGAAEGRRPRELSAERVKLLSQFNEAEALWDVSDADLTATCGATL